jgi:peptidoglycan/LPS O-acetylase OafA/YrhL
VLGILRFVLALLVLLSHIPNLGMHLNLGMTSVILFYFISGYLMGRSYQRFQQLSPQPIRSFYIDRLIKLMPQYILVVLGTCALLYWLGPAQYTMFLGQTIDPLKVLLNLLLLPANYVFEPLAITALMPAPVVVPAWSLATEFHFYLLLPLLLLCRRWVFAVVFCLAAAVQISAMFFAEGWFNSNNFGYRFIFGVLVFFLAGLAYGRRAEPFYRRLLQLYVALYLGMLLLLAPMFRLNGHSGVQEILLGAVLTVPLLTVVLQTQVSAVVKRWDEPLGRLAYPIFIAHFLVFLCCEKLLNLIPERSARYVLVSVLGTLLLAWCLSQLQLKVERYRIARRGFVSMKAP